MSKLLDDLIKQSRADTEAYEKFLQNAEALVRRLASKQGNQDIPAALHDRREAMVVYNNLPRILAIQHDGKIALEGRASYGDDLVELALTIDQTMRESAPAGWKGDDAKEAQVLNALFPVLGRHREATKALFELVKNQPGY
jgi:type I restriction enzyme R subunit